MHARTDVLVFLSLLLCSGCRNDSGSPTSQPNQQTTRPVTQPDDPQSVAALEKLGGRLVKNPVGNIVQAFLTECENPVTDEDLKALNGLSALQRLDVTGPEVTDTGIAYLQNNSDLNTLVLSKTGCADVGLESIGKLANLKLLHI
ncbi:MAG: hypothetical protein ABGZ17_07905, partial [Planctomycetaceae bacterium]